MDLQKVYEEVEYGEGYGHKRVGLRIDNRIIWFGYIDSHVQQEGFEDMERLVGEIVDRCSEQVKGE